MQDLREPVLMQLFAQLGLVEIIGKQIFHAVKSGGPGGGEAIDERLFAEQHGEVGGNFGTVDVLPVKPEQLARRTHGGSGRRVIQRQIEDFLELDDVVDLGPHRDVGDPLEDEFDDDRHLYSAIHSRAVAKAACESCGSVTRIALQPRPSATAT